jgi:hypothetical protein
VLGTWLGNLICTHDQDVIASLPQTPDYVVDQFVIGSLAELPHCTVDQDMVDVQPGPLHRQRLDMECSSERSYQRTEADFHGHCVLPLHA